MNNKSKKNKYPNPIITKIKNRIKIRIKIRIKSRIRMSKIIIVIGSSSNLVKIGLNSKMYWISRIENLFKE
jgi:hypothetical protein